MKSKKVRNWIFCLVIGLLTAACCLLPDPVSTASGSIPRVSVTVLSVDNSALQPLGIVYSGVQEVTAEITSGDHAGMVVEGSNYLNAALDKDKLFEVGDRAVAMLHMSGGIPSALTLIDHDRLGTQGLLFGLFGLLLILLGGVSGCGALVSLAASGVLLWKIFIPLLLKGYSPIWLALALVLVLTAVIDILVSGFRKQTLVALLGSLAGTSVTCVLAVLFGDLLKLDGGHLPYIVPLLSQSALTLNTRELFFAMVFIANSGALMDLSMDIASACNELHLHCPEISRRALLRSGMSVGRSVIGTMSTTLLLAYSGSYLSMLLYFAGQGTPLIDIVNYRFVASEVLITLVGSFGLVTVAPLTALIAATLYTRKGAGVVPENLLSSH